MYQGQPPFPPENAKNRTWYQGWSVWVQGTVGKRRETQGWDPSFPLENTKSRHPGNPGKFLKNYNLAHPGTVLKITEKLLKKNKHTETFAPKKYTFSNFLVLFR